MGDRYLRTKPNKSEEKRAKRAKRDEAQQNFKTGRGATLLSDSLTEVAGVYYRYIQERKFMEFKWKNGQKSFNIFGVAYQLNRDPNIYKCGWLRIAGNHPPPPQELNST